MTRSAEGGDIASTDVVEGPVASPGGGWRRRLSDSSSVVRRRVAGLPHRLPRGVRDQIALSAKRLAKVRSLKSAKRVLLEEAERLFVAVTPLLAAAPLPVNGWRARLAAGTTGGAAAVVEQAEEVAALVSWGGALPTAPVVTGAVLTAWVLELWIAVSARVNQLRAAGRQVDPETLGRELAGAYLGDPEAARHQGMGKVVRSVARRAVERWAVGLVPGAGIVFDTFASQRTVARILAEPVTAHPPALVGSASG